MSKYTSDAIEIAKKSHNINQEPDFNAWHHKNRNQNLDTGQMMI